MNAEAYFLRLERRTTVLFLLLLVEAVVMFVCWAVTPAPAEPPVLPTKAVPATVIADKLGSKDNPIECLYVRKLVVLGAKGEERITLETGPDSAAMCIETGKSAMCMFAHKDSSMLAMSCHPALLSLGACENTRMSGILYHNGNQHGFWPPRQQPLPHH